MQCFTTLLRVSLVETCNSCKAYSRVTTELQQTDFAVSRVCAQTKETDLLQQSLNQAVSSRSQEIDLEVCLQIPQLHV